VRGDKSPTWRSSCPGSRRLFCNPGGGTMVSHLYGQHGVGLASISTLPCNAGTVRRSLGGIDLPTSATRVPTARSAQRPMDSLLDGSRRTLRSAQHRPPAAYGWSVPRAKGGSNSRERQRSRGSTARSPKFRHANPHRNLKCRQLIRPNSTGLLRFT